MVASGRWPMSCLRISRISVKVDLLFQSHFENTQQCSICSNQDEKPVDIRRSGEPSGSIRPAYLGPPQEDDVFASANLNFYLFTGQQNQFGFCCGGRGTVCTDAGGDVGLLFVEAKQATAAANNFAISVDPFSDADGYFRLPAFASN